MPLFWRRILQSETQRIGAALSLLQKTANNYSHLSYEILNPKMEPGKDPKTDFHCLLLYSYGDLLDPLVSAFFFLRRRKMQGAPDAPGQWAYCLTAGAKDTGEGGLGTNELKDALNEVCCMAKDDTSNAIKLEIMHLPPKPALIPQNLQDVYDELLASAQPPKIQIKGIIKLGSPWVPKDSSCTEVKVDFLWLDIKEDPSVMNRQPPNAVAAD